MASDKDASTDTATYRVEMEQKIIKGIKSYFHRLLNVELRYSYNQDLTN